MVKHSARVCAYPNYEGEHKEVYLLSMVGQNHRSKAARRHLETFRRDLECLRRESEIQLHIQALEAFRSLVPVLDEARTAPDLTEAERAFAKRAWLANLRHLVQCSRYTSTAARNNRPRRPPWSTPNPHW